MKNDDCIVPSVNYCDALDRCILYCILFVFMLVLCCFCVATEFSVNKDLYFTSDAVTVICSACREGQTSYKPVETVNRRQE